MKGGRPPRLQRFLDLTRDAIAARVRPDQSAGAASQQLFANLPWIEHALPSPTPSRLPACHHLSAAIDTARGGPGDIAAIADAFQAIEPHFAWRQRTGATDAFATQHANADIIGPGGLESGARVRIGVSLMTPGTVYPDHRHPPEEVYLVLSPGRWRQNYGDWHEPGIGGIVYNPRDILHSMRSGDAPLLAVWCLWDGNTRATA